MLEMPGIFMHEEEKHLIQDLSSEMARIFNPCNIVHIGIGWGGSCSYSRMGAPHARIYGVDLVGADDLKGSSEQLTELNLNVIKGDSRVVYKDFHLPIHFLYIDGNHLYDCLTEDIKNWASMVVPRGFCAFHDCMGSHWSPDVNRAIKDTLNMREWEDLEIVDWTRYFQRREE